MTTIELKASTRCKAQLQWLVMALIIVNKALLYSSATKLIITITIKCPAGDGGACGDVQVELVLTDRQIISQ